MKCKGCFAKLTDDSESCPKCGMSISRPAPVINPIDAPRIAHPKRCIAYGCQLSGTWNPIIYGDTQNWLCFIHSELPGDKWQAATAVINRRLPELRSIPDDYAFRSAVRDVVAGREPPPSAWTHDGVTRNILCEQLREAHRAKVGVKERKEVVKHRQPGEDDEPALGIPLDDLEREFADAANP